METKNVGNAEDKVTEVIVKAQQDNKEFKLTKEDMLARFGDMQQQITKYDNISMKIEIQDSASLAVSETHISTLNKFINNIESVRKVFKEPYLEAGRQIDRHAKKLMEQFDASKKRISFAVTRFKELEQAKLKAEEEEKRKAAEAILEAKNAEIKKLDRIRQQIFARIYGGMYTLPAGERKTTAGCITIKDCQELEKFVKEKYPKPEKFIYMKDESIALYQKSLELISTHQVNTIELDNKDEQIRNAAKERIQLARIQAQLNFDKESDTISNQAVKEFNKEVKIVGKEIASAGRGLRTNINFTIINEDDVPVDMKEVSERKINAYVRANRERVLEMLKNNQQPIKGINLYVEKTFVSR